MGLISAAVGAIGGTLADQWIDFFTCEAMPSGTLVTKGQRYTGGRGSNKRGSDNVITNGSGIVVGPGQAAAVVDNGVIVEFTAVPGRYTYDESSEHSVFEGGDLGAHIIEVFKQGVERFKYGGGVTKDQRVYYFNLLEQTGNLYGTPTPVPFRVVDANIGLDIDISIRCNGVFSYRICNPIQFFGYVSGNVCESYTRDMLDSTLKSEVMTALQPAFAKISAAGIRYSALPAHTQELSIAMNEVLSTQWRDTRGLELVSFGVNSVSASPEDEQMIKDLQKAAVMRDPNMAAATITSAQADAMRDAANNTAGAVTGFIGMGYAQNAGGANPGQLFQAGQAGGPQQYHVPQSAYPMAPGGGFPAPDPAPGQYQQPPGSPAPEPVAQAPAAPTGPAASAGSAAPPAAGSWSAPSAAQPSTPGAPAPEAPTPAPAGVPAQGAAPAAEAGPSDVASWTCPACGHAGNVGKFCEECGQARPA
ncbi:MAG: SPFH domain-containing protein [Propionibacteriaceae bacterium]|jgi:membrane protease subunit (stomatin/prohibitin family)|nr:SPFH domain-containing protein [Propionibacteriaceae bacterium]